MNKEAMEFFNIYKLRRITVVLFLLSISCHHGTMALDRSSNTIGIQVKHQVPNEPMETQSFDSQSNHQDTNEFQLKRTVPKGPNPTKSPDTPPNF